MDWKLFWSALRKFFSGLLLVGLLGNGIDRALFGFVTDYVEVLFVRFAIFNLADCAICVGALLCAVRALKKEGP